MFQGQFDLILMFKKRVKVINYKLCFGTKSTGMMLTEFVSWLLRFWLLLLDGSLSIGLTLLAMLKTLQKGQLDFLIKCRMH